jgi:hypothetical protein
MTKDEERLEYIKKAWKARQIDSPVEREVYAARAAEAAE